jgi:CBS domain containing-hemolysin-like protein
VTSIIALNLEREGHRTEAAMFSMTALLTIILLGEMLPKNIAVLRPRLIAGLISYPLGLAVRALDPFMPVVRVAIIASRRLMVPRLQREPYLELGDLERAIDLGTQDEKLAQHEQWVLQNVVALDNIRVEEIMRPRLEFELLRPPVHLSDLRGQAPATGYVFIAERHSDEIASALPLKYLSDIPTEHLEYYAEKVLYVPWAASIASALEQLRGQDRRVAAVIDEHGGTIGIVTMDDVIESVTRMDPGSGDAYGPRLSTIETEDGAWVVTGMTPLRRLSKRLGVLFPDTKSVTVAGMVHEQLQHLPQSGDVIMWSGFKITVIRAPARGRLTVRFEKLLDTAGEHR